jgi:hypothetical protein
VEANLLRECTKEDMDIPFEKLIGEIEGRNCRDLRKMNANLKKRIEMGGEKVQDVLKQQDGGRADQGKGSVPKHLMMTVRIMCLLTPAAQKVALWSWSGIHAWYLMGIERWKLLFMERLCK